MTLGFSSPLFSGEVDAAFDAAPLAVASGFAVGDVDAASPTLRVHGSLAVSVEGEAHEDAEREPCDGPYDEDEDGEDGEDASGFLRIHG